ncbi:efflux RND transporter periplasmic adaptor subunit [Acetobacter malorum]|uniref:efflux RND transporter periplasmic adaptor subunit n=1 Tax=Acetobacter malorum TaxID=178901 RepID=UPI00248D9395|nr:efflux RND transporter periplasmic adaptor subunit [Acetobacter malorum]
MKSFAAVLLGLTALPVPALAEGTPLPPLTLSAEAIRNEGVHVVPVTQGTLAHMLPAMARVLPDTTRTVTLHTAGDGKVLSVLVLPGQTVKTGQPLLTYQNHTLHLARLQDAQTRAALAAASADRANAAAAYDRARALAGTTVSIGETRRRLAVLKDTQNTVATHEAELGVLAHRLQEEYTSPTETHGEDETSTIISPMDGTVTQVETAVAADVAPPVPLLTVSDTAHVWVVSDVPPQDAQRLVLGGRQKSFFASTGDTPQSPPLHSTIETIDTAADPTTGLVHVLSRVANPAGQLRPGTMLNSLLQTTQTGFGLIVPAQAVQTLDDQTVVFVQTAPDHFQPTPVRIGMEENDKTLVLSGLKNGDQVVSGGSLALKAMVILPGMDAD